MGPETKKDKRNHSLLKNDMDSQPVSDTFTHTNTHTHTHTHTHTQTHTDNLTPVFIEKSCKIDKDDGY